MNEIHLKSLHPDEIETFREFIRLVYLENGYSVFITSSFRSLESQATLDSLPPGESFHNYGLAIDINCFKNCVYLMMSSPINLWLESGIIEVAQSLCLVWGGEKDAVHFDLSSKYFISDNQVFIK